MTSNRLLRLKSLLKEYGGLILIGGQSFMLFKLVDQYLFSFNKLVGKSMSPTFQEEDGAIVLTDKLCPRLRGYSREDIVLFKNPFNSDAYLCKRIKGVAGDLEFPANPPPSQAKLIPANHVWLQGDNKNHSHDSRSFGPLSTGLGVGVVKMQVWPPSKFKVFKNA